MLDNGSSDADPSNVNSDPEEKCNQVGIWSYIKKNTVRLKIL